MGKKKNDRNELCWCGSGRKYKKCHRDFDERIDSIKFNYYKGQVRPPQNIINNEKDIDGIRKSGVVNNATLDLMGEMIKPGIDTASLDKAAYEFILSHGGYPASLNYEGFPKSVCISVNDVVCHGIPSPDTILKEGDIVNVDITTILDGYYADASRMYVVGGKTTPEAQRLVDVTKECMNLGIAAAKPWGWLGDISAACGNHAHANGYSVVTALGGHGVGKDYHLEPFVAHVGEKGTGMLLVPGMTLTVEPMINQGKPEVDIDEKDNWTVRTADHKLSAQWEKTILITETGVEIMSS
ncbi:MAG: type I methionyl aminopeptidase [Selenomonadaceae bacterium]|nr:type I methionyl aminopeptidase [Selenomonadaceae bacterium]